MRIIFRYLVSAALTLCAAAANAQSPLPLAQPNLSLSTSSGFGLLTLAMVKQSDGAVLVGGSFTQLAGSNRTGIARLTPAGTLDPAFNPNLVATSGGSTLAVARVLAVDGANNVYAAGQFDQVNGTPVSGIVKLSAAGAIVPQWLPTFAGGSVVEMIEGSGGPGDSSRYLYVAGPAHPSGSTSSIVRVRLTDGSIDSSFQPVFNSGFSAFDVYALAQDPANGLIYVGGRFGSAQAPNRYLFRMSASGVIDTTWKPVINGFVHSVLPNPTGNGEIYIGGSFSQVGGVNRYGLARLTPAASGTLDTTFVPSPVDDPVESLAYDPASTLLYVAMPLLRRYTTTGPAPGSDDPNWRFFSNVFCGQTRSRIVLQGSDLLATGGINGQPANTALVRLNSAGAIVSSLSGSVPLALPITRLATYDDGSHSVANGGCVLHRINADGTYRTGVGLGFGTPSAIAIDTSGNTFVHVFNFRYRQTSDQQIVKFNAQNAQQSGFFLGTSLAPQIFSLAADSTHVYLSASNPIAGGPSGLARYSAATGQVDAGWANGFVTFGTDFILPTSQGVYVAGPPASGFGITLKRRLLSTGAADPAWTEPLLDADNLNNAMVGPDGRIYVTGRFNFGGQRRTLARLNSDGSLDQTWLTVVVNGSASAFPLTIDAATQSVYALQCGATCLARKYGLSAPAVLDTAWSPTFTFNAGGSDSPPRDWFASGNGRLTAAGSFRFVSGQFRPNLAALPTLGSAQPTSTLITSDQPDPSDVGQAYPVAVTVSSAAGTPGGVVNVSDGSGATCTINLNNGSGSCALTSTSAGNKMLTASYTGNPSFLASSDTEPHQVISTTSLNLTLTPSSVSCQGARIDVSWTSSGFASCSRMATAGCQGTTWNAAHTNTTLPTNGQRNELVCVPRPAAGSYAVAITCTTAAGANETATRLLTIGGSCGQTPAISLGAISAAIPQPDGSHDFTIPVNNPSAATVFASFSQPPENGIATLSVVGTNQLRINYRESVRGAPRVQIPVRILAGTSEIGDEFPYTLIVPDPPPIFQNGFE